VKSDDLELNRVIASAEPNSDGTVIVPDWVDSSSLMSRSGYDLIIESPDGQVFVVSGYFSSSDVPSLETLSGKEFSAVEVAEFVEAGNPYEVAQVEGFVPPEVLQSLTEQQAEPDIPTEEFSSLEQLLAAIANGAELDQSMLGVFDAALEEAITLGLRQIQHYLL